VAEILICNCGAPFKWDSTGKRGKCEYCGCECINGTIIYNDNRQETHYHTTRGGPTPESITENGNTKRKEKDFAGAEQEYNEALRRNPKHAAALFGLAMVDRKVTTPAAFAETIVSLWREKYPDKEPQLAPILATVPYFRRAWDCAKGGTKKFLENLVKDIGAKILIEQLNELERQWAHSIDEIYEKEKKYISLANGFRQHGDTKRAERCTQEASKLHEEIKSMAQRDFEEAASASIRLLIVDVLIVAGIIVLLCLKLWWLLLIIAAVYITIIICYCRNKGYDLDDCYEKYTVFPYSVLAKKNKLKAERINRRFNPD